MSQTNDDSGSFHNYVRDVNEKRLRSLLKMLVPGIAFTHTLKSSPQLKCMYADSWNSLVNSRCADGKGDL